MVNLNTSTKNLIFLVVLSFLLIIASIGYWNDSLSLRALPWTIIVIMGVALIGAKFHDFITHKPHRDKHLYAINLYTGDEEHIYIIGYEGVNSIQIRNRQVIISTETTDLLYTGIKYREIYNTPPCNRREGHPTSHHSIYYNKIETELIYFMRVYGVELKKPSDDHNTLIITNWSSVESENWLIEVLSIFNSTKKTEFYLNHIDERCWFISSTTSYAD